MFKTIVGNGRSQVVEKKSKFIANAFYVESVMEAEKIIENIKKEYHDARHNCYAYRVLEGNSIVERQNDDGEPSRKQWCTNAWDTSEKPIFKYTCSSYKIFWRNTSRNRRIGKSLFRSSNTCNTKCKNSRKNKRIYCRGGIGI